MKLNRTKKGFTIVELVIVIAVIGVLSAILIPTFANLTNDARAAANKQQVADAYTAYLVEATDDQIAYEGYAASTGDTKKSANIKIAQKTQAEVALLLGTEWFVYNAEKGWESKGTTEQGTNFVVAQSDVKTQADGVFAKVGETRYDLGVEANTTARDAVAKQLSTFNGVLIYLAA